MQGGTLRRSCFRRPFKGILDDIGPYFRLLNLQKEACYQNCSLPPSRSFPFLVAIHCWHHKGPAASTAYPRDFGITDLIRV